MYTLAEYRLEELASAAGVSARNIRAYRERGLLDAPRREGRSAFYDDHHLSQLRIISDLLRQGYTSAHIAEFFERTREGHDLAEVLGLHQAIFGRRPVTAAAVLDVAPDDDDAQRLIAHGLARVADGKVTLIDPGVADVVTHATDQRAYLRTILRMADGAAAALEEVAAAVIRAWEASIVDRFGTNYVPRPEHIAELRRMISDHRTLGSRVVADQLAMALQRRLVEAVADYTTDIVVRGQWDVKPT